MWDEEMSGMCLKTEQEEGKWVENKTGYQLVIVDSEWWVYRGWAHCITLLYAICLKLHSKIFFFLRDGDQIFNNNKVKEKHQTLLSFDAHHILFLCTTEQIFLLKNFRGAFAFSIVTISLRKYVWSLVSCHRVIFRLFQQQFFLQI